MYRVLTLTLILSSFASAQFLDGQQDPPNLDWKSIHTKHYELIYPSAIRSDAQRVANLLEHIYYPEIKTMNYPFKKLPVLLSTQSVISNGYVSLAPRLSEWYGTPFQLGSDDGDWYELLATHEMRHTAQYAKLMSRGLNKYYWGIIGGEYAQSVVSGMLIPRWFWEGDAVLVETALSKGGRGRKPDFDMGIRTMQLNEIHYSYYKAMLGSYTDFVPNPYSLGYLVVNHARKHNPEMFWSNVLGRSAFFSFFPFGFSASMRGLSGKNAPTTYNNAMAEYRRLWQRQQMNLSVTSCTYPLSDNPVTYTNYMFPQAGPDNQIIALKSGPAVASSIIAVNPDGSEETLVSASPMWKISASPNRICWSSYRSHWRWGKQSYSDIILFDPVQGKKKWLTKNQKYFAPTISPNGKLIAAVEFRPERQSKLVVLDSENGNVLDCIPSPQNKVIKSPAWSQDSKSLVFTAQSADGKSLVIFNRETRQFDTLLKNTWAGITHPVFWENFILFSSGYSGIDNIYAIDTTIHQMYQVTSRPFGAFNPSIIPGKAEMLFNDYSASGYQIGHMILNPENWINFDAVQDISLKYFDSIVYQEQGGNIVGDENIPHIIYEEENYQPSRHLFNFHSWTIYPESFNTGIELHSNNLLNTTAMGAGIFFNQNEKSLGYNLDFSYGKFYPIIDFQVLRLHRAINYTVSEETKTDVWVQSGAALGLRLPINFSRGNRHHSISIAAYAQIMKINGQENNYDLKYTLKNGTFTPLYYNFTYLHSKRHALKDVRRQWAQLIDIIYKHTPFDDGINSGSHLFSRMQLYFPGVIKHHSLLFHLNLEMQDPQNFRFQPIISYPRGYNYRFSDALLTTGLDYAFPLAYPDFAISAWWYLKRIKANLFFDIGMNLEVESRAPFHSAGVELLMDHHWFSLPVEFEGGYRFSYKLDDQKGKHEIIFRIPLE